MVEWEKSGVTDEEKQTLLKLLEDRFTGHMYRHEKESWADIREKIEKDEGLLLTLFQMEETGGQPDLVVFPETNKRAFVDCVKETPKGRRSVCYDEDARLKRKKYPPEMSAMKQAEWIGIDLLSESEYRQLQGMEAFDEKTSSWLQTPDSIRELGGAIFGDRRYNEVFIYHNGADSYYGVRGFRGKVNID